MYAVRGFPVPARHVMISGGCSTSKLPLFTLVAEVLTTCLKTVNASAGNHSVCAGPMTPHDVGWTGVWMEVVRSKSLFPFLFLRRFCL
jgi:hypothetical protein